MDWHVIYTGVNSEHIALRGLQSKGFEVYCPTGKRMIRHARQSKIKIFPVFSRYIFVRFDPLEFSIIKSEDGVIDILRNDWIPVRVSPWLIEEIKIRENSGHFDLLPAEPIKKPKWSRSFNILKNLLNVEATA